MSLMEKSCIDFVDVLASKEPVPGGGGASALAGAVGMALGNMVGSLTVGKKKYEDVREDILALMERANRLQAQLLALADKDAEAFAPLAKAYGMASSTEEEKQKKAEVMETALKAASDVPLEIMRCCGEAVEICRDFAEKGSRLAISDAAAGAALCGAALNAASLNVYINTKSMKDRETAAELNRQADRMRDKYSSLSEMVLHRIIDQLK